MRVLNVNLTDEQYKFIQTRVKSDGFANVSEYMRAIVRFLQNVKASPKVHLEIEDTPTSLSPAEIEISLAQHGYSKDFIKSVAQGFKESAFYKKHKTGNGR